jgi:hypothetical protein
MECYKEVAIAIIESLGGNGQVKSMLIRNRRGFLVTILPDAIKQWSWIERVDYAELLYFHGYRATASKVGKQGEILSFCH